MASPYLHFPFSIGADGRSVTVGDAGAHAREQLIQLLLTNLGERWYLPRFGTNLRRMLFEGIGESTDGLTKAVVTQAVERWLPGIIEVRDVIVAHDEGAVRVELQYRLAREAGTRVLRLTLPNG